MSCDNCPEKTLNNESTGCCEHAGKPDPYCSYCHKQAPQYPKGGGLVSSLPVSEETFITDQLVRKALRPVSKPLATKEDTVNVSPNFYNEVMSVLQPQNPHAVVKSILPKEVLEKIKKYRKRMRRENPRMTEQDLTKRICKKFNIELV